VRIKVIANLNFVEFPEGKIKGEKRKNLNNISKSTEREKKPRK
jgi:hypothetical protein